MRMNGVMPADTTMKTEMMENEYIKAVEQARAELTRAKVAVGECKNSLVRATKNHEYKEKELLARKQAAPFDIDAKLKPERAKAEQRLAQLQMYSDCQLIWKNIFTKHPMRCLLPYKNQCDLGGVRKFVAAYVDEAVKTLTVRDDKYQRAGRFLTDCVMEDNKKMGVTDCPYRRRGDPAEETCFEGIGDHFLSYSLKEREHLDWNGLNLEKRRLEQQIAAICRKTAAGIVAQEFKSKRVAAGALEELLGPPRFKDLKGGGQAEIGLVHGLAWTRVGGEILDAEVGVVDGTGKLELTGNLGTVMQESAKAALTYIRSRSKELGLDPEFYKKKDIHIHFPEGAVPKDGPSAGVTITTGLVSALTGTPVRQDVAMTGEITLRGRVLPIGGLKEKTMAALRAGIHTVILPAENEADLAEIDPTVRQALNFVTASRAEAVLDTALVREGDTHAV